MQLILHQIYHFNKRFGPIKDLDPLVCTLYWARLCVGPGCYKWYQSETSSYEMVGLACKIPYGSSWILRVNSSRVDRVSAIRVIGTGSGQTSALLGIC